MILTKQTTSRIARAHGAIKQQYFFFNSPISQSLQGAKRNIFLISALHKSFKQVFHAARHVPKRIKTFFKQAVDLPFVHVRILHTL